MNFQSGRPWEFAEQADFWPDPEDEPDLAKAPHTKNTRIAGTLDRELYPLYISVNGTQYKAPITVPLSELGG